MPEVISISKAKTNLSKLVKRAQAGETIYIGAYGNPQAVLSPLPARRAREHQQRGALGDPVSLGAAASHWLLART